MTIHADIVFENGSVFDGSRLLPTSTRVAISGTSIIAVGSDVDGVVGVGTRRVDLEGGLLLPGFTDAHIHPIEGGLERMRCDLSPASTRDEYLSIIRAYAEANPDLPWILGGGWQLAAFPGGVPQASDLDAVVGARPVFLANRDHHGAWVSTRALELAGIDRNTPDPVDGRIERNADGSPSGVLQEGARLLVSRLVPDDTDDDNYSALLAAQGYLHSVGVTGWQDAIVGDYGNHSDTGDVYLRAAKNGDLTARVVAALWWDRNRGSEQIPELVARREQLAHERFAASSIKIMQDGIPENQTAAMIDPYVVPTGCRCGAGGLGSGLSFVDPAVLGDYVASLDALAFQIHFHAIGDRAVREALDAFAEAQRRNGPSANRHHIAHVQVVHPHDISRFAELDVTANLQTLWASFEPQMVELNLPVLGEERSAWQYPFADLANAGSRLASGSDWPVTTPDPWAAIHVAVNRTLPPGDADYTSKAFYPAQSLTLEQALASYTSGSARINGHDSAGRIAEGFDADLVVVDRDPFASPTELISETRTRETWVRGRQVF
ncbi:amidohydrolase [Agreia pratensis]|uniref:amidohydrolase n=1 Tax=Agreia pratensis TaxID=150121 RepID=UPI00188CAEF8|nr:amidohydrolase [Agreia pratensis]MBF4634715.1 amidohydrolase [Agreia pratensis]